ncbi:MAG: sigma-70 family RNA polymerase sigma factor [Actinomycetota bacterium]
MAPDPEDLRLIKAAQRGDQRALDRLLAKHQARIYAICRRLAGNDADALDATQEALIAIVRGLGRFDGRAAFTTWSYRVATNAALDELRRRGRRPEPGLPEYEQADDTYIAGRESRDPSEIVAAGIDVDSALAELPEEFRAPVVLRDMAGMDYAEIADVLDLAPGTVRSRIARGRGRLADVLASGHGAEQTTNSAHESELAGNQIPPDERQSP